jgi:hypothetical protein
MQKHAKTYEKRARIQKLTEFICDEFRTLRQQPITALSDDDSTKVKQKINELQELLGYIVFDPRVMNDSISTACDVLKEIYYKHQEQEEYHKHEMERLLERMEDAMKSSTHITCGEK